MIFVYLLHMIKLEHHYREYKDLVFWESSPQLPVLRSVEKEMTRNSLAGVRQIETTVT